MSSEHAATAGAEEPRLVDRLRAAPPRLRPGLLGDFLQAQLADALGVERGDVDRRAALMELGMDSLKAIEAKLYLEDELGLELGSSLLFDYPTIENLSDALLEALGLSAPGAAAAAGVSATSGASDDALADLSITDVAALLSAELASLTPPNRGPTHE